MKKLFLACIATFALTASATPCNKSSLANFIAGNYTMIAREPDSKNTYSGTMSIENPNDKIIRIVEKVPHQLQRIWRGEFRDAAPGEGCVLSMESKERSMACLISTDLDNYARITCLTKEKKIPSKRLGLVALFPMPT